MKKNYLYVLFFLSTPNITQAAVSLDDIFYNRGAEYLSEEERQTFVPFCSKQLFQQCLQNSPPHRCNSALFDCICTASAKKLKREILFPENEAKLKENNDKIFQIMQQCFNDLL